MSMITLAFHNFKASFKNYISLIISLAFTISIVFNFQNMVYSGFLETLGETSARNIKSVVIAVNFVLVCFMLFFVWYSTNVFLTKRKKEIGIYVFMGLTNQKIGKLYMIETVMIGLTAWIFGMGFGVLTTQLFQMILLAISEISIELSFTFDLNSILTTSLIYLIIYSMFVIKGYINIVRSNVLDLVAANKKNEYVKDKTLLLMIKAVLGVAITCVGYYLAIKEGGMEVFANVFSAVILVVIGTYLLFGGLIPVIYQNLAKNKHFLYQKQRNLWINNTIFRIKKNYRTYAMVCVLMLCSVTALATSFAMRQKYDGIIHFRNTYTYQILSNQMDLDTELSNLIEKDNQIDYSSKIPILVLDSSLFDTKYINSSYAVISYSQVKQLAVATGLIFDLKEPSDNEIISVTQLYLLNMITDTSNVKETINHKEYNQIDITSVAYLGILQEKMSFYMVSDEEYQNLKLLGQEIYSYNYRIKDIDNYMASIDELDSIVTESDSSYTACIISDPNSEELQWVKVLYSICVFMFLVFILASGSVLFMKIYNDAFEERERYQVLSKLGIELRTLKKSVANELRFAYLMPFIMMSISSYFSVHSLAKVMQTDLLLINVISVIVIFVFFYLCYRLSVYVFQKNSGMR